MHFGRLHRNAASSLGYLRKFVEGNDCDGVTLPCGREEPEHSDSLGAHQMPVESSGAVHVDA